jgi:hypothetical protein
MSTRKQIIIKHYLEFQKQLHDKNFDCSIFPSLEDVCLVDLLVLFNYTFNNSNPIAPILGKDRRILTSKIQQYKNLFPEILGKFKLKKNPTIEDLQEAFDEMDVIVNCSSVEDFLNDSILQCLKMIEGASSYTRYDVSGMSDLLRQNKQFHQLSKMLYIKYKVFSNIPPEYQMVMLMATTAYVCVEKNKRKASLEEYLNTAIPPNSPE